MVGEAYREKVRKHWQRAIFRTFGSTPDLWTEVRGSALTLRTLSPFLDGHMAHALLPVSGTTDFESVTAGVEPGTLEFRTSEASCAIVKPGLLRFGYVEEAPEESFFVLEAEHLAPTGEEPGPRDFREILFEYPPRSLEYLDASNAFHGISGYDEHGSEIPLPARTREVHRFNGGSFMIVSQMSLWNGDHVVDDASLSAHSRIPAEGILSLIKDAVRTVTKR